MLDAEESCVYCSKLLVGLNEFNRKMHVDTCKVRKLVDANRGTPSGSGSAVGNNQQGGNQGQSQQQGGANSLDDSGLDGFIVIGDNCSYCFKSFKDFKSDFNKRLHIKCCKIKKETYDEKNSLKMSMGGGEHCVFCTKPLSNLNEFNKRMHIENCKIRKSIENSGQIASGSGSGGGKRKDESLVKLGIELGENCIYCSKSFMNLSDFNKKLHFEYCKLKKKGKGGGGNGGANNNANTSGGEGVLVATQSNAGSLLNVSQMGQMSQSLAAAAAAAAAAMSNQHHLHHHHHQQTLDELKMQAGKLDLGESCLFCSRSLANLSNFNKRIHIETCKIKTLKKATTRLRQTQSAKTNRKRAKKEKEQQNATINYANFGSYLLQDKPSSSLLPNNGSTLGKNITLELLGGSANNNNTNNANNNPNNNNGQSLGATLGNASSLSQFDSLAASLNLTNSINLATINTMNPQQIKIDPSVQYAHAHAHAHAQNPNGLYI